jgi:hypothetical protein
MTGCMLVRHAVRDIDRAKAFAASPDLRETMQKVGVVNKPDIYFLKG